MPIAFRLIDIYYGTNIIPVNGSDGLWYLLAIHGASMAALGALRFCIYRIHGYGHYRTSGG